MNETVATPWDFTGNGYIMLFKFPKSFILDHGFLDKRFHEGFYGNVGAIVFADYQTSKVGSYQELFFIPGKLRYQHHSRGCAHAYYTISQNFISYMNEIQNMNGIHAMNGTPAGKENSVDNQLENSWIDWGIPKERASFEFSNNGKGLDVLKVTQNGTPVIDITIKYSQRDLAIPLRTFFHPLHMIQYHEGKTYQFNLHGKGSGRFAEIMKVDVNPELFPNFAFFKHVAIIRVNNFHLKLPTAKIREE